MHQEGPRGPQTLWLQQKRAERYFLVLAQTLIFGCDPWLSKTVVTPQGGSGHLLRHSHLVQTGIAHLQPWNRTKHQLCVPIPRAVTRINNNTNIREMSQQPFLLSLLKLSELSCTAPGPMTPLIHLSQLSF